jgi:hypothetical protein
MEPIGQLWLRSGMLRLYRNPGTGRLYAEVLGCWSEEARCELVEVCGQLEELSYEVVGADDPAAYGLDLVDELVGRINHHRVA